MPETPQKPNRQHIRRILTEIWNPLDEIGQGLMGDLWRPTYLTIQDTIAVLVLVFVLSLLGSQLQGVTGQNFADFRDCHRFPPTNVNFYQCYVITGSNFTVWFIFGGRFILHFWETVEEIWLDWREKKRSKLIRRDNQEGDNNHEKS